MSSASLIVPSSRKFDVSRKKGAAQQQPPAFRGRWRGGQRLRQLAYLGQRVGVERVVHPAALPAVGHQPGVLQHLEVERQPRLGRVERVRELTDATLTQAKALDDREPGTVG